MGYRRRSRHATSRWIVAAVFAGVAILVVSVIVGRLGGGSGESAGAAGDDPVRPEERVRVEVLNGAGDPGAAERAAGWLRAKGFDVVYFGNAEDFDHQETVVVDRSGEREGADRVARTLGLDSATVDPRPDLFLEATVILGSDWRSRLSDAPAGGTTPGAGRDSVTG